MNTYPAAWLNRVVSTTDVALGGPFGATKCISFTIEGGAMYVFGKVVDADSISSTDKFDG